MWLYKKVGLSIFYYSINNLSMHKEAHLHSPTLKVQKFWMCLY